MNKYLSKVLHVWHTLFQRGPTDAGPVAVVKVPVLTPPAMVPDGKPTRRPPINCARVREYYVAMMDARELFADVRDSSNTLRLTIALGSPLLIRRARDNHRRTVALYRAARARVALTHPPYRQN